MEEKMKNYSESGICQSMGFLSPRHLKCLYQGIICCVMKIQSVELKKKIKLSSIIRSPTKSVSGSHNPKGLSHLTQLRVGLSKSKFHTFKHNFRDTVNPMCPTHDGIEDMVALPFI